MRLYKQLDMTGERQHRPSAGRQYCTRHIIGIGHLTIPRWQVRTDHRLYTPEKLLVLDFVVGKTHQRFKCELIVKDMGPTLIEHFGTDEAFDQTKEIRISPALNLTEQARLRPVEKGQTVDLREPIGQELAREIETPFL
ncbi:hypothetical protein D3C85_1486940 [compost metagenome]